MTGGAEGYFGECRACNLEAEIGTEEVPHPIDARIHTCVKPRVTQTKPVDLAKTSITPVDWQSYAPTEEEIKEAKRLIAAGYKQTSAKYRSLARIPEGHTPLEALAMVDPAAARELMQRLQDWAESSYMRVHSRYRRPEDHIEVSDGVFKAFKKLGGEVAR